MQIGVVFATELPEVTITAMEAEDVTVGVSEVKTVNVITTPAQANFPEITVESSDTTVATASIVGKKITVTGVATGTATVTITAGNIETQISVTVE